MKKKVCCICDKEFEGYGNNPWPIKENYKNGSIQECCDDCNVKYVISARLGHTVKLPDGNSFKINEMED